MPSNRSSDDRPGRPESSPESRDDFDPQVAELLSPLDRMSVPPLPQQRGATGAERPARRSVLMPTAIAAAMVLIAGLVALAVTRDGDSENVLVGNAPSGQASEPSPPTNAGVSNPPGSTTAATAPAQVFFRATEGTTAEPEPSQNATVAFRGIVIDLIVEDSGQSASGPEAVTYWHLVKVRVQETYRSNIEPGDEVYVLRDASTEKGTRATDIYEQVDPAIGDEVLVQSDGPFTTSKGREVLAASEAIGAYALGTISVVGGEEIASDVDTVDVSLATFEEAFTSLSQEFELERRCPTSLVHEDPVDDGYVLAFITGVDNSAGRYGSITFDQVVWVNGDQYDGGYIITNDDPTLRTLPIRFASVIWLTRLSEDSSAAISADDGSLTELGEAITQIETSDVPDARESSFPFVLTLVNGEITEMCEVYRA